jgi:hypothetical protein
MNELLVQLNDWFRGLAYLFFTTRGLLAEHDADPGTPPEKPPSQ